MLIRQTEHLLLGILCWELSLSLSPAFAYTLNSATDASVSHVSCSAYKLSLFKKCALTQLACQTNSLSSVTARLYKKEGLLPVSFPVPNYSVMHCKLTSFSIMLLACSPKGHTWISFHHRSNSISSALIFLILFAALDPTDHSLFLAGWLSAHAMSTGRIRTSKIFQRHYLNSV